MKIADVHPNTRSGLVTKSLFSKLHYFCKLLLVTEIYRSLFLSTSCTESGTVSLFSYELQRDSLSKGCQSLTSYQERMVFLEEIATAGPGQASWLRCPCPWPFPRRRIPAQICISRELLRQPVTAAAALVAFRSTAKLKYFSAPHPSIVLGRHI